MRPLLSHQTALGAVTPYRARTGFHASAVWHAGCIRPEFPAAPLQYVCTVGGTAGLLSPLWDLNFLNR